MDRIFTLKLNHMLKKSLVSITMLGLVVIALASSGGGKKKAGSSLGIIPIRANGTFAIKTKAAYSGSFLYSRANLKNSTVYRSVVTYQKGNTTFIIPSQYRVNNHQRKLTFNSAQGRNNNLNAVNLKIKICR